MCLVSYEFPPSGGGEGAYTYDLARALKNSGNEVILVTPRPKQTSSEAQGPQAAQRVEAVPPFEVPGLKTTGFMIRANRRLKRLVDEFDLVHYTNDYCGFGLSGKALGSNKPIVATIHHTHSLEASSVRSYLNLGALGGLRYRIALSMLARLEKSTLRNADRILAVSHYTARNAEALYPSLKDRMRVIPNAVDEERFSPGQRNSETFRQRFGLDPRDPVVLFVGRLAASKGVEFLIQSFRDVLLAKPRAKLLIVGSGRPEQETRLRSLVSTLGLTSSVLLAGRVSEGDLPAAYAASDLVALPSLVEGFGLVLLEGMASGKPVVATEVGPTEEIITNGADGLLVPRADPAALSRAITTILSDESLARKMGDAGRRKVEEKFSIGRWTEQMIEAYREVV